MDERAPVEVTISWLELSREHHRAAINRVDADGRALRGSLVGLAVVERDEVASIAVAFAVALFERTMTVTFGSGRRKITLEKPGMPPLCMRRR